MLCCENFENFADLRSTDNDVGGIRVNGDPTAKILPDNGTISWQYAVLWLYRVEGRVEGSVESIATSPSIARR